MQSSPLICTHLHLMQLIKMQQISNLHTLFYNCMLPSATHQKRLCSDDVVVEGVVMDIVDFL